MRAFVIGWLVAFAFVGAAAVGIGSVLGGAGSAPPPTPVARRVSSVDDVGTVGTPQPFTQDQAVAVVAARFPTNGKGEEFRREIRRSARVTYHSSQHWTVHWGAASWTAHGPGRYAEPDNDAAREREAEAATGP
jgi:hypothetical protein